MSKGLLIVLSGPSGVGKGTIYSRLLKTLPNLTVSVSVTTRKPREGEINGVHYYFTTKPEFTEMRDRGELLEYAETVGNFYGTPKTPVLKKLDDGVDVILEIDVKGAKQIKRVYPDCITIFILPPSEEELKKRLVGRGTETAEQVRARLALAKEEIAQSGYFDYNVINNDIDVATDDIIKIIKKQKESKNVNRSAY